MYCSHLYEEDELFDKNETEKAHCGMTPVITFLEEIDSVIQTEEANGLTPAITFYREVNEHTSVVTIDHEQTEKVFPSELGQPFSSVLSSGTLACVSASPQQIKLLPSAQQALEPIQLASDPVDITPPVFVEAQNDIMSLAEEFKAKSNIRIFEMNLYCFEPRIGHYRRIEKNELRIMIDQMLRAKIRKLKNPVKGYNDLVSIISCQHDLVIENDSELTDPFLWPFHNVILNIQTGTVVPNDGRYFLLSSLQCNYDPYAQCPNFDAVISYIAAGSKEIEQLLWEIIGYILSPDTKAKKFFVFFGEKNSGKSMLANVLRDLVGVDSVSSLSTSQTTLQFATHDLYRKRLNVSMDLANVVIPPSTVGQLKMLTGGDMVYADQKNKNAIQFQNSAKILLGTNYSLQLKENDDAFLDRMIAVPFRHSVPKEQMDHYLAEKLRSEYSGIVNKAIQSYLALKRKGLIFTEVIFDNKLLVEKAQVINYDLLNEMAIEQCFVFTENENNRLSSQQAYMLYSEFCTKQQIKPDSKNNFSRALSKHCIRKDKARIDGQSVNAFFGVKPRIS